MNSGSLEDFIKENKKTVKIILYKSKFLNMLDHDDISDIMYTGLWKVWKSFDASKAKLSTYINVVISNYIIDIIKKKKRYRDRHISLENAYGAVYIDKSNPSDDFTDEEWTLAEPIYLGKKFSEMGISRQKYKKICQKLGEKVKIRLR